MKLIKKIYDQKILFMEEEGPSLITNNLDAEKFECILCYTYLFDSDLHYSEVNERISLIFKKLELDVMDYVFLII